MNNKKKKDQQEENSADWVYRTFQNRFRNRQRKKTDTWNSSLFEALYLYTRRYKRPRLITFPALPDNDEAQDEKEKSISGVPIPHYCSCPLFIGKEKSPKILNPKNDAQSLERKAWSRRSE